MSDITKEEIIAYTEAQNKSAVALEKIVDRLGDMVIKQDKILTKVSDGLSVEVASMSAKTETIKTDVAVIKNDVFWLKIIWGSLAGIVALGMVIIDILHKGKTP